jgi:hypothetical protein
MIRVELITAKPIGLNSFYRPVALSVSLAVVYPWTHRLVYCLCCLQRIPFHIFQLHHLSSKLLHY